MLSLRRGKWRLTDVGDMLQHGCVRRYANQQLELVIRSSKPEANDKGRQNQSGHRIDPPAKFSAENSTSQTGSVDEEIVAVVFPEDADLAVCVAESVAVQEEAEFRCEGDGDDDR